MRRSLFRPLLLGAAAVLLLSATAPPTCTVPSDVRQFADDVVLVDLPELDGTFVFEGAVPFDIVRLGGGQYEYRGPITVLPDLDRITPAERATLEERFWALGLPEPEWATAPEWASPGEAFPPPALEPRLQERELICPPAAWSDGRRCHRLLAERLEPACPGVLAFEEALAELPTRQVRERARFSLHQIGPGRLAGQTETVLEVRWQAIYEPDEGWDELWPVWRLFFWADDLSPAGGEYSEHDFAMLDFEQFIMPHSLVLLRPSDDGSFIFQTPEACLQEEHLAAYGFTWRPADEADETDSESIVPGLDADILGLLDACFPEDPAEELGFWRIDAPAPSPAG